MKTTFKTLICTALCCAAWSAFAVQPPPKDTITVTAHQSANGVNPSIQGNHWLYVICIPSGGTLNDNLHIELLAQNNNDTSDSTTVSFNAVGSDLGVTVPGNIPMSDTPSPEDLFVGISLNKSGLPDGTYNANVKINVDNNDFTVEYQMIQIQVVVGSCQGPQVTCWFTDSDYNNLFNCDMQQVTGDSGGTFQIVKNAKNKVVATNPGQFYYNMLVPNTTGTDQTVTVNLSATDLNSQGAQAAHAAAFDPVSGFPAQTDWLFVNSDGSPCGPNGPCTMTVPAGQVLFVTWHLAYSGTGGSATGINTTCETANRPVSATGTVSGGLSGGCTANATGYLKQ